MRNSIFKQYFLMISAVILISIFSLGAVLLLISSNQLVYNKKKIITDQYMELYNYMIDFGQTGNTVKNIFNDFKEYEEKFNGNIIITDSLGNILNNSFDNDEKNSISHNVLTVLDNNPTYFYGNLDGFYSEDYHIVASRVELKNAEFYLFLVKPDINEWGIVQTIMSLFGISFIIEFIFLFILTYFVSRNTVRPLVQMSVAAKKLSKGDFSTRINIDEKNEIGDLANALNEMAISLENSETMRKNFIANVSHELKTPMTSISGFVDGILDGTIPESEHKKYLEIVSFESKRLSRLVVSMLNMAKFESGEVELNYSKVNINSSIIKCLLSFEKQINDKNIDIYGLDKESIIIYADNDLIYQVIYNLVENAIKFVNQKGYIEFNLSVENDIFTFSIKNSGDGIKADDIPLIFDKFYKSDKSRSLDKTGVGLGLYIANSIINLHDGSIHVNSESGMYTEFVFSIPAKKSFDKGKKN